MKNAIKVLCFVIAFIVIGAGSIWFYFTWDKGEFEYVDGSEKGTAVITDYLGESKNVVIPKRLRGKKVTIIGESAFKKTDIESIEIGNNVTVVEKNAFNGCQSLKTVKLCEGVRSVGENAFIECKALETVTVPSTLEKLGDGAFIETAIKEIDFSNNDYFTLKDSIIYSKDMTELVMVLPTAKVTEYVCPDTLTDIHSLAFNNHAELKSFKFNEKITKVNQGVFANCTGLEKLTLPKSVVFIDGLPFVSSGLKEIFIPASTTKIDKVAFVKMEEQLTIVTPKGSFAERYAKNNGLKVRTGESL